MKSLQIVIKSVPFSLNSEISTTHGYNHARTDETNDNILQPYPVVAADVLLEICKAVISVLLSSDEHLSQTNSSCVRKSCLQSVHCCLFRNILLGVRIAKRFTKSNKRFWWKVKFKNEPTLCSWIHHIRICTCFAQLVYDIVMVSTSALDGDQRYLHNTATLQPRKEHRYPLDWRLVGPDRRSGRRVHERNPAVSGIENQSSNAWPIWTGVFKKKRRNKF